MATPAPVPPEAIDETVAAIRRVGLALKGRFHARLAEHGLTFPQAMILRALHKEGRRTARELADAMCVTPANITGILDRLERDRLVTRSRNPDDRRVVYVRLTEKGHGKVEALQENATLLSDLFEGWSEADLKKLRALLAKVRLRPEEEHAFG